MKSLIVLSAFQKFGDYAANSTEIVSRLLSKTSFKEFTVYPVLLPADIPKEDRGKILFSIAQKINARGIICLGMASEHARRSGRRTSRRSRARPPCSPAAHEPPWRPGF